MSPEQAAGRTDLNERTDVFSLACALTALMHRLASYAAPPKNQQPLLENRIAPERVTPTT
ncbi:MAG: hypothetical protein O7I93_06705 [Gemmatimonadetes bacterium]|nr:hypothetical protein [Gemmatimonadota bacterium]